MPATIPTQEDLDKLNLAFNDHLEVVDAKLLEFDGRVKALEDKLIPSSIGLVPLDGEDAPYPEDPDNPVNPEGSPPLDPPPSPKSHKKHK